MQGKIDINVLLIGDLNKKANFMRSVHGLDPAKEDCKWISCLWRFSLNDQIYSVNSPISCNDDLLEEAHAIIYLDPTEEEKDSCEQMRKGTPCIAIDFHLTKFTPKECLEKIEDCIQINLKYQQASSIDAMAKSMLVALGRQDATSDFSVLPQTLVEEIRFSQLLLANKHFIFGHSTQSNYIAPPAPNKTYQYSCTLF